MQSRATYSTGPVRFMKYFRALWLAYQDLLRPALDEWSGRQFVSTEIAGGSSGGWLVFNSKNSPLTKPRTLPTGFNVTKCIRG